MTQPGSAFYAQSDAERMARQSQERGWQVEQARQQAQQQLAALQQGLDAEYQQAQQVYAQYESQARDALAATAQEARMAEQRVQRPNVYPYAPPTPPGVYPQMPQFASGGMVLPRFDMGGSMDMGGGGGRAPTGRFRAIPQGTGYVIVDVENGGRIVSVVYPDPATAQAAADRLNGGGGQSSLNENSGAMGGPAIPAPGPAVQPAPAVAAPRPAAAPAQPAAAARPQAPAAPAAPAPQAAASAAPAAPPAPPVPPTTSVGTGVRRSGVPQDGGSYFFNPQTKQWQAYTPTYNPYQQGVDPDAPTDGGAYFFNPQTRQWQGYTPTYNPPAASPAASAPGGAESAGGPPMPPAPAPAYLTPEQNYATYSQEMKDAIKARQDAAAAEEKDRERMFGRQDAIRENYGMPSVARFARGGEFDPMSGPPMPPGMDTSMAMEGDDPTAIVGDGESPVTGEEVELVMEPTGQPNTFIVKYAEGPTGAELKPGTIIIPPQDTPKLEKLVRSNFEKIGGVPMEKSGSDFVPAYRKGGMSGPPMPPMAPSKKKPVAAKGKK